LQIHQWSDLDDRLAGEYAHRPPGMVFPNASVEDAFQRALRLGVHHLVVVNESREPLGVLCTCDLLGRDAELEVGECMSSPAETVDEQAPASELLTVVKEHHRGCVPVLSSGQVGGVVTRGDLRRAGALAEEECERCSRCSTFHHVRADAMTGEALCVTCRRETEWEWEGEYIELGEGD